MKNSELIIFKLKALVNAYRNSDWKHVDNIESELSALESEPEEQEIDVLGLSNPWPLLDVLKQLVEATEILLQKHSYDGHGHEELQICVKRGKEIIFALSKSQPVKEAPEIKTAQQLINSKANKIQHYSRDGFNTMQTIELMKEYHAQFTQPETEKKKLREELIKFKVWFENLSPANKCTVHPPAGSGGCYGLYTMSDDDLIDEYLNSQTKRQ
jgi:hypothetical protein